MLSLEFVLFFHFWFVDEAREDLFWFGGDDYGGEEFFEEICVYTP